jgi:hypothetical protein
MAFNLIILCDTRVLPDRDFREVVKRVRRIAPDVHAFVASERRGLRRAQWVQLLRPTLFVQIDPLQGLRVWRGTLAAPVRHLRSKMAAYRILESAGLPVPSWREIVPGIALDPEEWGCWVVVKPDLGLRGIDIEAVATSELRYRTAEELPPEHLGRKGPMLAQRFVPTTDGPAYYRVTTCFGVPILAIQLYTPAKGTAARAPEPGQPPQVTVDSAPARFSEEADILDLARRVHALLPQVPTIGCDFLRHRDTGQLWISEINLSNVWQLSSPRGIGFQARTGLDLYAQFGALDRAAEAMVAATRRFAR